MTKTRSSDLGSKAYNRMRRLHEKFARNFTHRLVTETIDTYEKQVTTRSTADTTIRGDIQEITFKDKALIESGWAMIGDAVLYISAYANPSDNIVPDQSMKIDGVTGDGVCNTWIVVRVLEHEDVKETHVHSKFLLRRTVSVTL